MGPLKIYSLLLTCKYELLTNMKWPPRATRTYASRSACPRTSCGSRGRVSSVPTAAVQAFQELLRVACRSWPSAVTLPHQGRAQGALPVCLSVLSHSPCEEPLHETTRAQGPGKHHMHRGGRVPNKVLISFSHPRPDVLNIISARISLPTAAYGALTPRPKHSVPPSMSHNQTPKLQQAQWLLMSQVRPLDAGHPGIPTFFQKRWSSFGIGLGCGMHVLWAHFSGTHRFLLLGQTFPAVTALVAPLSFSVSFVDLRTRISAVFLSLIGNVQCRPMQQVLD